MGFDQFSANLQSACETGLRALKEDALYREFIPFSSDEAQSFPYFADGAGRQIATFCSNDYLAMSRCPAGMRAVEKTLSLEGVGAGGSRNIGGTRKLSEALESELADLHRKDAALILNSGYLANLIPMKVFSGRFNAQVFSDEMNHASIIDGLETQKTGVDKFILKHNDPADLREKLERHGAPDRPKLVIFESLYSMEGDFAPIEELTRTAKSYGATVILNEVHAVGALGEEGAGASRASPALDDIDMIIGTFGKGYGTFGGYLAGDGTLVDAVRCFGRGLIFTTALPPIILAATLANIKHLRRSSTERIALAAKSGFLKERLTALGVPILFKESHILSVPIGDEAATLTASARLLENGYYVTPIRYPTVARGDGRLRVTVTPKHDDELIEAFAQSLATIYRDVGAGAADD